MLRLPKMPAFQPDESHDRPLKRNMPACKSELEMQQMPEMPCFLLGL